MNSGKRKARAAVQAKWADLPRELLEIISGGLRNPSEIVEFRSVCRSWRSSAPLPPNKLSALFPRKGSAFFGDESYHDFNANAVYLVRPRSNPSKAWLVSIQEPAPGRLVLRHALTYQEMKGDVGLDLEADWIAATQTPIAKFYAHNTHCVQCNGVNFTRKVVFVSELSEESGCRQLVGLCSYPHAKVLLAFRLGLGSGSGFNTTKVIGHDASKVFKDIVKFNGRIFAVDVGGFIYVLDHTNLQLIQATEKPVREYTWGAVWVQFVVSNGDLYVVWIFYSNWIPTRCEIYRLREVVVTDGNNKSSCTCSGLLSERVEDLRDRVFFLTHNYSFSISAQLLPHPWREGNCIFVSAFPWSSCTCARDDDIKYKHVVFRLGSRRTFTKLWTPEGHSYLDLFSPPASFVVKE